MAFGNITTLYLPTTANAGTSQWGTDVRKLLDAADAASDALTKTNHGTGASVVRTFDPYTTTAADLDQSLYGWAIAPSDMNSVAGALRFYPAGNHVATIRVGHTASTAKSANFSLTIYRVGPAPTRTRTLLGTANSGTVSIPGLAGELTVTITVALPEVIFAADETIQYSFEVGAAGTAITGDIITLFTGTQSAVVGQIATPKLGVLADTTGTADGSSSASGLMTTVLGTTGAAAGSSDALGLLSAVAGTMGEASGSSTALGLMSAVAGTTGTAAGSSSANGLMGVVLGTTGTATVGADCPSDWPTNDGLKSVSGIVRDHETGAIVPGATVCLVRESDAYQVGCDTADGAGAYSFPRDTNDPYTYRVVVFSASGTGMSEGCVPG